MLQYQLKLRLTKTQEKECEQWLYHLTSVWNWAIRKIELNANDKIYFSRMTFLNLLANHSKKLGVPSHVIQGILKMAYDAWVRRFDKISGKPKLKGVRNKLRCIPFPDPLKPPKGNRIVVLGLGSVRFHKMDLPKGKIKCARIIKRASGWYLCLMIDAEPKQITRIGCGIIGIDPGFEDLLTLSTGEKIEHPRELETAAKRLAQAQRGRNKKLVSRINQRIANRVKDRNHKLSHKLVAENVKIFFSKDDIPFIARKFGKSVRSSAHGKLRRMLEYKSPQSGTQFVEVSSRNSTMTCSSCGARSGPTGFASLKVRQWKCSACGAQHDRDVNAAQNILIAGAGCAHEVTYV